MAYFTKYVISQFFKMCMEILKPCYRAGEDMERTAILLDTFQQHFQKRTPLVKEKKVT